jgi:hypothetical protein
MENEKVFRTKTGFCHVLDDKIVLTKDIHVDSVAEVPRNAVAMSLAIYGVLAIGLFYLAFVGFQKGSILSPAMLTLIGLFLVYGILTSTNNSVEPILEREKIKSVKLRKAITGLTRSRFEIMFEDNNGRTKKRLIMLPGSLTGGDAATERAVKIMTEEGLLQSVN